MLLMSVVHGEVQFFLPRQIVKVEAFLHMVKSIQRKLCNCKTNQEHRKSHTNQLLSGSFCSLPVTQKSQSTQGSSLDKAIVPNYWKKASVCPILKKGENMLQQTISLKA